MRRYLVTGLLLYSVACGGSSPSISPTTPTTTGVTYTLAGTVTASATGAGIPGATVTVQGGANANLSATTDASGNFTLASLYPSKFTVTASAAGYGPTSHDVVLTGNQTVNFQLAVLPAIVSFTADPTSVQLGQTTILRWVTKDATSCDIQPDNLVGTVPCNGQVTVTPTSSVTSYTLSVSNAAGAVSQRLDVAVGGIPDVEYRVSGSAARVEIWVLTASGGTTQFSGVQLPWTYDIAVVPKGQSLEVSAQNDASTGCVTVEIYKLGNPYKSNTYCTFGTSSPIVEVSGVY